MDGGEGSGNGLALPALSVAPPADGLVLVVTWLIMVSVGSLILVLMTNGRGSIAVPIAGAALVAADGGAPRLFGAVPAAAESRDLSRRLGPAARAAATRARSGDGTREPERFADEPAGGAERRTVRYHLVRVVSEPNEWGREVGRVDRGDEVEILESDAGHLRIRTPRNVTGWIPAETVLSPRTPPDTADRD